MNIRLFGSKDFEVKVESDHPIAKKESLQGYIDYNNGEIYISPDNSFGVRAVLLHEIFHDFCRIWGGSQYESTIDAIARGLALNMDYNFMRKFYKLERELKAEIEAKNATL